MRLRRCAHFIPGASEKMLAKGLDTEADAPRAGPRGRGGPRAEGRGPGGHRRLARRHRLRPPREGRADQPRRHALVPGRRRGDDGQPARRLPRAEGPRARRRAPGRPGGQRPRAPARPSRGQRQADRARHRDAAGAAAGGRPRLRAPHRRPHLGGRGPVGRHRRPPQPRRRRPLPAAVRVRPHDDDAGRGGGRGAAARHGLGRRHRPRRACAGTAGRAPRWATPARSASTPARST